MLKFSKAFDNPEETKDKTDIQMGDKCCHPG